MVPSSMAVIGQRLGEAESPATARFSQLERDCDKLKKGCPFISPKKPVSASASRPWLELLSVQDKVANRAKEFIAGLNAGPQMAIPEPIQESVKFFVATARWMLPPQALKAMNERMSYWNRFRRREVTLVENLIERLDRIRARLPIPANQNSVRGPVFQTREGPYRLLNGHVSVSDHRMDR